jgi:uncharacterized protein DUF5681
MKKPSSTAAESAYEVGYGKPPKAKQFRKGRTGNPRGKKRGEENIISVFKRVVLRRVKINDGEKVCTISVAEAVIRANYQAAVRKNPFAMANIYRLAEDAGELVDFADANQVGKPLFVPIRAKNMHEFLARHGRTPETE